MPVDPAIDRALRVLNAANAAVWALTALGYVSADYRAIGARYLALCGLPDWLMPLACAAELVLAAAMLRWPGAGWLAAGQIGAIAGFSAILAAIEPMLLVSPFGMLTKNLPMVALVALAWRLRRDGWSRANDRLLVWATAIVWLTEGLLPKLLFQQRIELAMADRLTGGALPASAVVGALGLAQIASFAAALVLRARALRAVLALQFAAMLVLPLFAGALEPWLWTHPFGAFVKNLPILAGTWLRWQRCSTSR